MSYSFTVSGRTRKAVMAAVTKQLAQVVQCQPEHAVDVRQAAAAVEAQLSVVDDISTGFEFLVSVNGSISWTGADGSVVGSALNINVYIQPATL